MGTFNYLSEIRPELSGDYCTNLDHPCGTIHRAERYVGAMKQQFHRSAWGCPCGRDAEPADQWILRTPGVQKETTMERADEAHEHAVKLAEWLTETEGQGPWLVHADGRLTSVKGGGMTKPSNRPIVTVELDVKIDSRPGADVNAVRERLTAMLADVDWDILDVSWKYAADDWIVESVTRTDDPDTVRVAATLHDHRLEWTTLTVASPRPGDRYALRRER